jgi:hypothetical protein
MGKGSKSRRFVQQGSDSVKKHAERFPYRSTLAERETQENGQENL